MSSPDEPDIERTVIEQPAVIRREELVERRDSGAGWWIAGLVAIVALVGVIFLFSSNRTAQDDIQAARDAGRSEAMIDSASQQAQTAAATAAAASQSAADSVARAGDAAAQSARASAERAAQSADQVARSASESASEAADTTTAPPPQE